MKMNFFKLVAGIAIAISTQSAFGQNYDLTQLDVLKTCTTPRQIEIGKLALSHLQSFVGWHMKEQMEQIHPDYTSWHSSLAGLLVAKPEYQETVPFKKGQWTKATYLETMAFLAFANDITLYQVVPKRVDCVGSDRVILVSEFNGRQIRRDTNGCPTHGVAFGSPTKIDLQFVDVTQADGSVKSLVYRSHSNLDDTVSAKVREELATVAQGPANIPFNPGSCKTYQQILTEFKEDAGVH